MKLFLDDLLDPPNGLSWWIARSYEEAVTLVQKHGFPEHVSFDHDLGDGPTGMDFAHYMIEIDLDHGIMPKNFTYTVHSANPIGEKNIEALLDGYIRWKEE